MFISVSLNIVCGALLMFISPDCVQVTKFNKLLRKVIIHDEDDDSIVRLPELYYVPYDKVCLVYSHYLDI